MYDGFGYLCIPMNGYLNEQAIILGELYFNLFGICSVYPFLHGFV